MSSPRESISYLSYFFFIDPLTWSYLSNDEIWKIFARWKAHCSRFLFTHEIYNRRRSYRLCDGLQQRETLTKGLRFPTHGARTHLTLAFLRYDTVRYGMVLRGMRQLFAYTTHLATCQTTSLESTRFHAYNLSPLLSIELFTASPSVIVHPIP